MGVGSQRIAVMLGVTLALTGVRAQSACPDAGMVERQVRYGPDSPGFLAAVDTDDRLGVGVAEIGDIDGDGIPDIALGAPNVDDGGPARGTVWIVFPLSDGRTRSTQRISSPSQGGLMSPLSGDANFGFGIDGIGDLDGDGVPDMVVGAPGDDAAGTDRGSVLVLFLNRDGTVKNEVKIHVGDRASVGARFGTGVACLGDLDGDGTLEVAI